MGKGLRGAAGACDAKQSRQACEGVSRMKDRRSHLDAELRRLEESCLYTGQAQFETVTKKGDRARTWLVLVPGIAAAVSGAAVAVGGPIALGAIAALAGVATTVGSFLGVDRVASAHELAAKTLTALRHEARFLREATAPSLSDVEYHAEIKRLADRYNSFQLSQPTPDPEAFAKARANIKGQLFEFDADQSLPAAAASPALADGPEQARLLEQGTDKQG